jgi:hypothetical protein
MRGGGPGHDDHQLPLQLILRDKELGSEAVAADVARYSGKRCQSAPGTSFIAAGAMAARAVRHLAMGRGATNGAEDLLDVSPIRFHERGQLPHRVAPEFPGLRLLSLETGLSSRSANRSPPKASPVPVHARAATARHLIATDRAPVGRIERQDDWFASQIRQREVLIRGDAKRKIRRNGSRSQD